MLWELNWIEVFESFISRTDPCQKNEMKGLRRKLGKWNKEKEGERGRNELKNSREEMENISFQRFTGHEEFQFHGRKKKSSRVNSREKEGERNTKNFDPVSLFLQELMVWFYLILTIHFSLSLVLHFLLFPCNLVSSRNGEWERMKRDSVIEWKDLLSLFNFRC